MSIPHPENAKPSRGNALAGGPAAAAVMPASGTPKCGCCGGSTPASDKRSGGTPAAETAKSAGTLLVALGNKKCPVMGGTPDGKTFREWNGLLVGFCCPECTAKFATNPEQYLNDAGVPWREAADAVKAVDQGNGAERAKDLADLKRRWRVVREPTAAQLRK